MEQTIVNLSQDSSIHTANEILHQPAVWQETLDLYLNFDFDLRDYIGSYSKLILTGAGTSSYIGFGLQNIFRKKMSLFAHAISTTDIVATPSRYLDPEDKLFLVSFARSGNSPESVATVQIANHICQQVFHLIITCNPDGALVQEKGKSGTKTFMLPSGANDQGLAMTSSYSSMLLAGWLIANNERNDSVKSKIGFIKKWAQTILVSGGRMLNDIAALNFSRAIFLGSGSKTGAAMEGRLKLQELTDGRIMCSYDSFLGFRHGPKAIINEDTLMVYVMSNDNYTRQYEEELIREINHGVRPMAELVVSSQGIQRLYSMESVEVNKNEIIEVDDELSVCAMIIPLQIIPFYKSILLGLSPDSPSVSGAITRVVQGVNIYPFNMKNEA